MCRKGEIRIDGKRVKASAQVAAGQKIRMPPGVAISDTPPGRQAKHLNLSKAEVQEIRASVIFRDESILVLNKPPNLATQGGTGQRRHIDGMAAALQFDAAKPPLLVHRLDKDTSGVLVMARTIPCARVLTAMFRRREPEKCYWALVSGIPLRSSGTIRFHLYRLSAGGRGKMNCVSPGRAGEIAGAKVAITRYSVIETVGDRVAAVALDPVTGRTHQLRAHMAKIGNPIVGDVKYGSRTGAADAGWTSELGAVLPRGLQLHARSLKIDHPESGDQLEFIAPLPAHMQAAFAVFGWSPDDFPAKPFAIER